MSSNESPVPDYLMGTYTMLKCAYPEGIPETEYLPVMALLYQIMSFRTMARVLSALTDKSYSLVYNDVSGFEADPQPSPEQVETVKRKLDACDYEDWFNNNKWW